MKANYIKYVIVVGVIFTLVWNTLANPYNVWLQILGIGLCVALMGWVAWVWHHECVGRKDATKLESYAEQIYMLGYLLTLSAIGGALLRLLSPVMSGATLDTAVNSTTLFSVGGVKLVSTIFGLLIMFFFKEEAAQWSGNEEPAERYLERIRLAAEKMVTHAETVSDQVQAMAAALSPALVQDLGRNMKLFSDSVASGHRAADDFVKKTDACAASQGSLRTELDKATISAGQLDVGLKNLETASTTLKTGLDEVTPKLHELANLFSAAWFADLKKQFRQLLDACARSLSIWQAFEQQTTAIATKSLVDLKNKIDGAAESTGKLGSSLEQLSAKHFPAFAKEFQQITEGAINTRKYVLESVAAISKAAETLQILKGVLENLTLHSTDISQMGAELQKIKEGTNQLRANVQQGLEAVNGVTTSLGALNTQLAHIKENSTGFPATMANLRQTVGTADTAFGGVNGRLRSFAEGLDAIIARTGLPRPAQSVPLLAEKPQGPGLAPAVRSPVQVRLPVAQPHVPRPPDSMPQPVQPPPAQPILVEKPQVEPPKLKPSSEPYQPAPPTEPTAAPQRSRFKIWVGRWFSKG